MLKRDKRTASVLMIALMLIGLAPTSAFAAGQVGPGQSNVKPGVSVAPAPEPIPFSQPETVALPADFEKVIRSSALTQEFETTFAQLGLKLSYAEGYEFFVSPWGALGSMPIDARSAVIPVIDAAGFGVGAFSYTYGTDSGIEGAEVVQVLRGDGSDGTNTLRAFLDPSLKTYIDMKVDKTGQVSGAGGVCVADVQAVAGVADQGAFAQSAASCSDYWDCVGEAVVHLILLGHETGLSEACVDACLAGGVANPACIACIVGAIGSFGVIWWNC